MVYDLRHADTRLRWLVTCLLGTFGVAYLFGAWMVGLYAGFTALGGSDVSRAEDADAHAAGDYRGRRARRNARGARRAGAHRGPGSAGAGYARAHPDVRSDRGGAVGGRARAGAAVLGRLRAHHAAVRRAVARFRGYVAHEARGPRIRP